MKCREDSCTPQKLFVACDANFVNGTNNFFVFSTRFTLAKNNINCNYTFFSAKSPECNQLNFNFGKSTFTNVLCHATLKFTCAHSKFTSDHYLNMHAFGHHTIINRADKIEDVQRKFMKKLKGCKDMEYLARLLPLPA